MPHNRTWLASSVVAAATLACTGGPADIGPETQRLEAAEFVALDRAAPPGEGAFAAVTLPHLWSRALPEWEGSGWYRLRFEVRAPTAEGHAVYLPKLNMNAAVLVNGAPIGDGGRFEPPVAQHWNRPLYFRFPGRLLRPGTNEIHVRLYAYAHDWGGLFPLYVGPHAQLVGAYERQHLLQIGLSQLASVVVLMLAIVMGALALGSRDSVYWYWALGCGLYFVHSLSAHVRDIHLPYPIGRWLIHASFDLFAVALAVGMHRWAEVRRPRLEGAVVAVVAAGALITLAVPGRYFLPIANGLHLVALAVGVYASAVMVRHFGRLGGPEVRVTIAAGLVTLGLGAHALLIYLGVLPQDEPRLLKLMAPVLMLGFGGVLVARYVRSAREAARLNLELEARVAARESELRTSYEHAKEMEKAQLLTEERARLMREMHDGMGGRLVSLLSLARAGAVDPEGLTAALQSALDEMRIIVDSLDPDVADLGALLGLVRERVEPRMKMGGASFRWKVGLLPEDIELTPHQSLDVLRFMQEGLTNVIKHAGAQLVELGTHLEQDEIVLYIEDDGHGFDPAAARGRGLANLEARAARLGGRFELRTGAEGTRVALGLPRGPLTRRDR